MTYPRFFELAPRVTIYDPLAEFLGSAEDGLITYSYTDAVRLAGHSCPTVASTYLIAVKASQLLFPNEVPQRGGVAVELRGAYEVGTTGVVGNVLGLLTGAAGAGGFAGIGGKFSRRNLLTYGADITHDIRFTRLDTNKCLLAQANLKPIPTDPTMGVLMQKCLSGSADANERAAFKSLWQTRVKKILVEHADDSQVFQFVEE